MKHIKALTLILFFSLPLTGCGKQTLKCSKSQDIDSGKAVENQTITFDNNKISTYEASFNLILNDEYIDYKETIFEGVESSLNDFEGKKGIEYDSSKKDDSITITIKGNYGNMDDDVKDSLGIPNNVSFKKTIDSLENEGYTCEH